MKTYVGIVIYTKAKEIIFTTIDELKLKTDVLKADAAIRIAKDYAGIETVQSDWIYYGAVVNANKAYSYDFFKLKLPEKVAMKNEEMLKFNELIVQLALDELIDFVSIKTKD